MQAKEFKIVPQVTERLIRDNRGFRRVTRKKYQVWYLEQYVTTYELKRQATRHVARAVANFKAGA